MTKFNKTKTLIEQSINYSKFSQTYDRLANQKCYVFWMMASVEMGQCNLIGLQNQIQFIMNQYIYTIKKLKI